MYIYIYCIYIYMSKEMASFKGLLHMFKTWCNCQKRQLIQLIQLVLFGEFFAFPKQTNDAPSKEMAAGFR